MLALLVAMLALLVAVLGLAGTALGAARSGESLTDAHVCGSATFSEAAARCTTDERAGVLSSTLHCSARVRGLAGTGYTGTFSFRGRAFPTQKGVVRGDGWIYTSLSIKGGTFPAGAWICRISASGNRTVVAFRTTGATGTLTATAACPTTVTVLTSGVRACNDDRSTRTFAPTSRVTCSGVYSLGEGRHASASLLYKGRPTGLVLRRILPHPVSVFGMQVERKDGLPAGRYTCVFSLDGKQVATKPFSIRSARVTASTR
jgi:hypothetical protein